MVVELLWKLLLFLAGWLTELLWKLLLLLLWKLELLLFREGCETLLLWKLPVDMLLRSNVRGAVEELRSVEGFDVLVLKRFVVKPDVEGRVVPVDGLVLISCLDDTL